MKKSQTPLVSIVIPHRGADGPLRLCIEALRQQTYPASQIEILSVINEPIRRNPIFELKSNEKILWEPDYYSYAARNKGIEASKGSIIALTDSDTIPDPDWIEKGTQALLDGPDLVAGAIRLSFSTSPLTPSACYEKLFAFDQEKNANRGRSATANLFVKRVVFDTHGLFDSLAESGEDFEWTSKATLAGSTLVYSPHASVAHPARETWKELIHKARRKTKILTRQGGAGRRLKIAIERLVASVINGERNYARDGMSLRETSMGHAMKLILNLYMALDVVLSMARVRLRWEK
jgi:cellulose synthase/poly-beta-1,6-N-acetylglucosamine synthase-like glycosyltransferase